MKNWVITKIKNQVIKYDKYRSLKKLNGLKKKFKSCGNNVYIKFPICIEGPEYISVGNDVSINPFVHMWGHGGISIGDNCLIASHCAISSLTHNTESKLFNAENIGKPVHIGNNVWIGSHAVILPGVRIGDNVVIGAGSVVNKDIPANSVYAGVPARKLRDLDR